MDTVVAYDIKFQIMKPFRAKNAAKTYFLYQLWKVNNEKTTVTWLSKCFSMTVSTVAMQFLCVLLIYQLTTTDYIVYTE